MGKRRARPIAHTYRTMLKLPPSGYLTNHIWFDRAALIDEPWVHVLLAVLLIGVLFCAALIFGGFK